MPFIEAKLLQWKGEALLELKEKYLGGQKCSVLVLYKMSSFMLVLDFLSCYSMCLPSENKCCWRTSTWLYMIKISKTWWTDVRSFKGPIYVNSKRKTRKANRIWAYVLILWHQKFKAKADTESCQKGRMSR